ncbi:hypothetical protein GGR57DRAFT_474050 [Xylariaceae sp. FL1272]|nr:hypothetical protein GGR57DRAFT_474050 [Xylariaceae sp. FL1272]
MIGWLHHWGVFIFPVEASVSLAIVSHILLQVSRCEVGHLLKSRQAIVRIDVSLTYQHRICNGISTMYLHRDISYRR